MRSLHTRAAALVALLLAGPRARAAELVIDAPTGPVTAHELAAFKEFMQTRRWPAHSWGEGQQHNALADGTAGRDLEALGLVYEISKDVELLDRMIAFTDAFVAMRNDLPDGEHRVMWTGAMEKVWVPEPPRASGAGYAGGENGDTIAHIEYTALLILRERTLWERRVPDGDPRGYGATYLARAKTYLARCDEANDEYSARYFVQPATNLIRNPPNWPAGFHTMEAINIQMMLDGGFQRNAEAHELLGDDPARVARYDAIVRTSVRECLDGMKHPYRTAGHIVWRWYYYPWDTKHVESVGHAAYDVLGLWRASTRSAYGIRPDELAAVADTLSYAIARPDGRFARNVDGSGEAQDYMLGEWLPVGLWNDSAFALMATADAESNRTRHSPHMVASLLWMKAHAPAGGVAAPAPRAVRAGCASCELGARPQSTGVAGALALAVALARRRRRR
jgi:hypothetical protein